MSHDERARLVPYGVAALATLLAVGFAIVLHQLVRDSIVEHAAFPILHCAVGVAATAGGWGPALATIALTSGASVAWFTTAGQPLAPQLLLFVIIAVLVAWLCIAWRRAIARSRRQEALITSQLDALFSALPVGVALMDRDLRYVRINPLLAEMNDTTVERALGRTLYDVLPSLASELAPLHRQVLETGEPLVDVELRGPSPGDPDTWRHWRVTYVPVGGEPGHPEWVGVKAQDVTDRVELARALALETERRQFLLDLAEAVARAPGADAALRLTSEWLGVRLDLSHALVALQDGLDGTVTIPPGMHQVRGTRLAAGPIPFPLSSGRIARELARHGTVRVEDVHERGAVSREVTELCEACGIRAFVAVPLHRAGTLAATLVAADDKPRRWKESEVRLLREAAERVWPIYEIAELLEESRALTASLQMSQTELAVNERRLRLALTASGTGVWGYSPKTQETHWSPEMNLLTGTPPGWFPESPTALKGLLAHPEELAGLLEQMGPPEELRPLDVEFRIARRSDGAVRWVRLCAEWLFVPDPESPWLYGTLQDVTEHRAHEERMAALNVELERRVEARTLELAESNRALDEANKELEAFSYSVSHDLRAPLRAMDGFSQALLEDYADRLDDDGRKFLGFIREGAQHMAQLVNDMLNLSRMSRRQMTRGETDLTALAMQVLLRLRRNDPARDVEVVVEPGLTAHCDSQLVGILLTNLLGNAWKFTGRTPGARIEFRRECRNGEDVYVVSDNGAGFDMQYAGKLFVPFQRLHGAEEFEGTGIGLATVHRVVRKHGGRVWAEGEVGKGATFRFTLAPAASTRAA